jgi:hypothetical protein
MSESLSSPEDHLLLFILVKQSKLMYRIRETITHRLELRGYKSPNERSRGRRRTELVRHQTEDQNEHDSLCFQNASAQSSLSPPMSP